MVYRWASVCLNVDSTRQHLDSMTVAPVIDATTRHQLEATLWTGEALMERGCFLVVHGLASTAMPGSHTRRIAVALALVLGFGLTTMEGVSRSSMCVW